MQVSLNNLAPHLWLQQSLKILVSVALVGYCLSLIDIQKVGATLANVDWSFLVLAFLFTLFGTIVFKTLVAWRLLSQWNQITFFRLVIINLSLRFYTMILPKAVVAGIRWSKYRKVCSKELSLVLVSFEALLALVIAALATAGCIYVDGSTVVPTNVKIATGGICILSISLGFFLFFSPNAKMLFTIENFLTHYKPLNFSARLLSKWRKAATQLQLSKHHIFWPVLVFSVTGHLLFLIGGYLLFLSLSIDIRFTTVAWIRSAVFILVSVPISFAGIGIREVGFVALFGLYGMDPDSVIAYAMLALIVQTAIGFIGMTTEINSWFVGKTEVEN